MIFKSHRLAGWVFLILNSQFVFLVSSTRGPQWARRLSLNPPRGRTKARGCKTRHRIVQAVGQGDPLGWRLDALLWSGFGSPWQRVRSHPALSKVSARASRAREAAVPFILSQQPLKWGLFFPRLVVAADDADRVGKNFQGPFLHLKEAEHETECLNIWK